MKTSVTALLLLLAVAAFAEQQSVPADVEQEMKETLAEQFPMSDDEDCLMCHRYEKLGRMTQEGERKSYFVQPEKFFLTAHRNVSCRDCHHEINEIPHEEIVEGVNCAGECHIKNPATGDWFNHGRVESVYKASAHARDRKVADDDIDHLKPYCTSCHLNPVFNPHEEDLPKDIITTCIECHESGEFAEKWYLHTTMRINRAKTNPLVINEICGSCHGDPLYMTDVDVSERSRNAYESYRDSFHGKYAQLDWVNGDHGEETLFTVIEDYIWDDPPHCLDCHADPEDPEKGIHDLRDVEDPRATIHPDNVSRACSKCHEDTSQAFAMISEVHNFKRGYSLIETIIYEFFFWLVSGVFFVLTLRITLDHNRKIIDRWFGTGEREEEEKDLQEGL